MPLNLVVQQRRMSHVADLAADRARLRAADRNLSPRRLRQAGQHAQAAWSSLPHYRREWRRSGSAANSAVTPRRRGKAAELLDHIVDADDASACRRSGRIRHKQLRATRICRVLRTARIYGFSHVFAMAGRTTGERRIKCAPRKGAEARCMKPAPRRVGLTLPIHLFTLYGKGRSS